ncbi:glutathionylspermidine synthase family protein [Acinetobacter nosocomialis]|nr:glutathionylspermidine synthase family protein [Acinetobacter nosocomialis]MDB0100425.1 glutathionylspermidine synthase family protein [Acinetobacter nosocomialis]MDB0102366.1 glutathionylspermidine synthase family protein [Acinetobacter nosocomialis]MDB0143051.1 glutathionylspermidine synthase family protein [Acinetobacter nosocomialis]
MKRKIFTPRPDWQVEHQHIGFDYFNLPSLDGSIYWPEGVAYEFTLKQIEQLEDAANELHQMCLSIVGDLIQRGDYPAYFQIPETAISHIEYSWKQNAPMLYGRFDFAYDGRNIKMLEYNADTPTGLLEASVAQWLWIEQVSGIANRDQFNSIHEDLIKRWKTILPRGSHVHFAASQEAGREDWGNLEYLMDTAYQAHLQVSELSMENIGWNGQDFVDLHNQPIQNIFKLYPWEWIWEEAFSQYIYPQTQWIEPCWKMLLSNKAILVELWKRYPNHPLLVETHTYDPQQALSGKWVKKPILAREGANIRVLQDGHDQGAASGSFYFDDYDKYGYVIQKWVDTPLFSGQLPTLGLWMVGHQCAGMSIREDCYDIIGNDAHFAAHYFVE